MEESFGLCGAFVEAVFEGEEEREEEGKLQKGRGSTIFGQRVKTRREESEGCTRNIARERQELNEAMAGVKRNKDWSCARRRRELGGSVVPL